MSKTSPGILIFYTSGQLGLYRNDSTSLKILFPSPILRQKNIKSKHWVFLDMAIVKWLTRSSFPPYPAPATLLMADEYASLITSFTILSIPTSVKRRLPLSARWAMIISWTLHSVCGYLACYLQWYDSQSPLYTWMSWTLYERES